MPKFSKIFALVVIIATINQLIQQVSTKPLNPWPKLKDLRCLLPGAKKYPAHFRKVKNLIKSNLNFRFTSTKPTIWTNGRYYRVTDHFTIGRSTRYCTILLDKFTCNVKATCGPLKYSSH